MKKIKKILCIFLVVLMCMTSAPLSGFVGLELPEWNWKASAVDEKPTSGQCGDNAYWSFDKNTGIFQVSGIGDMWDYNDNFKESPAYNWFYLITEVIIEHGITNIGGAFFNNCHYITKVAIPNSVISIDSNAFIVCNILSDINIPESVEYIDITAFECRNANFIVDPNNKFYSSEDGVLFNKEKTLLIEFSEADKKTTYYIPDSVVEISKGAFAGSTQLIEVTIGKGLENLIEENFHFNTAFGLERIFVNSKNKFFSSENGVLFDKNQKNLIVYPTNKKDEKYVVPDSVEYIYFSAFGSNENLIELTLSKNCRIVNPFMTFNLTTIHLPNKIVFVEEMATLFLSELKEVYFYGTEEEWNTIEIGDYNDNLLNANIHFMPHSHQYIESITKKPTCIAKGEKKFTCDCGDSHVEEIPPKGHDFKVVDSGKAPTCEEDGYTAKRKCSVCGKEDGGEVIPSDGHIDNNGDKKCDSCGKDMSNDERTVIATGQCGDKAFYTLYSDGELVITGEGAMWDYDDFENKSPFSNNADIRKVTIETEITSIGAFAFCACVNLVIVTTGNKITTIGNGAFSHCYCLEDFSIPEKVKIIGSSAFFCCESLQKINIPEGVTIIEDETFYDCIALTNVTIPNSVTTIGDNAFDFCSSITDITIGKGVTYIGNEAFRGCKKIESVFIPQNVANIGDGAFSLCYNLSAFVVEDGNKNFSHDSYGVLFNKEKTVLVQYPIGNLNKKYSIPDSVETVDVVAFKWSDNLSDIIIGTNVTFIGDDAFSKCTGLTDITIPGNVISIGMGAFSDCSNLVNVVCENGVKNIGIGAFNSCISLESITFGDSITSIEECAFYYCYNITDVYYYGVESQWNNIDIEADNDDLLNATIHFLGEEEEDCTHKETFEQTIPASCTVAGMKFTVCVDCGETIGNPEVIPAAHTPGEWETVIEPTYEAKGKKVKKCTVCGETLEEEIIPKLEKQIVEDEGTGVAIEISPEDYDGVVEIEVEESFDGTAFNILDAKTGAEHKKIYDIKMLVDGEVTQPNGKITVKIPLPAGYNPKFSYVYYVNTETGAVEKMNATYEDGYMVFETDHFSYYAIIAEPDTDNCSCNCHAGGIKKFFFKIGLFFQKIFKKNKTCKCGIKHY